MDRPPRQRAQPVAVEIGQDRVTTSCVSRRHETSVPTARRAPACPAPDRRRCRRPASALGRNGAGPGSSPRPAVQTWPITPPMPNRAPSGAAIHTGKTPQSRSYSGKQIDIRGRSRRIGRLLDGPLTLCHRNGAGTRRPDGKVDGGNLGPDARQTRADHGRGQQPLDRLGHRARLPRPWRRPRLHLPGRGAQEAGRAAGRGGRRPGRRPLRRHRPGEHGRGVRGASSRLGARSTSCCTPSPFPTRTSSTAAMSTPPQTISPRPCWSAAIRSRRSRSAPKS